MKNLVQHLPSTQKDKITNLGFVLEDFFIQSLEEMYYAESEIAKEFALIEDSIISPNLKAILKSHYAILLKHNKRLEKIFRLKGLLLERKKSDSFSALLSEAKNQLSVFTGDSVNWEIALILVSQKLAHYKIASYSGLAHVAIKLNYYKAATLLAISAQEEEEFVANNLNDLIDAFLSSHVKNYKN